MSKKYVLNKGHLKISRGIPRVASPIDVEFCDLDLKNRFKPLTHLLSDDSMGWAECNTDDSEHSSDSESSSDNSPTNKRCRRPPRGRPHKPEPPEPPRHSAPDKPSRIQRRHNYIHAQWGIRDKKAKLSDMNTTNYLSLHKPNDTESDFFAWVTHI